MGPREPPPRSPAERLDLEDLVRSVEAELEAIFGRYCMAPGEAHEMLMETLAVFRARERQINNPRGWLLAAIEDRCRRYVEEVDQNPEEEEH